MLNYEDEVKRYLRLVERHGETVAREILLNWLLINSDRNRKQTKLSKPKMKKLVLEIVRRAEEKNE